MYNSDRKFQFMDETGATEKESLWISAAFKCTAILENELNKDIAMMTADEVSKALAASGVISSVTMANRIPLIVRYKNWCYDKGFDVVQVRSGDIHIDMSDNIRNTMVCTPSQLARILNQSFPDSGPKSSACIYRAYLWFGFAGMYPEDAASVRISDVDLNRKMVSYNNRWYELKEEGIRDVRRACKLDEFERERNGKQVLFKRDDSDRVLRGRRLKKEISISAYVRSTLRPRTQLGFTNAGHGGMSFLRIRRSGIFYEMLSRELKGFDVNFYTVAHDDFDYGHRDEDVTPIRKSLRRSILMYERDYAAWKKAFAPELMQEFGVAKIPGI